MSRRREKVVGEVIGKQNGSFAPAKAHEVCLHLAVFAPANGILFSLDRQAPRYIRGHKRLSSMLKSAIIQRGIREHTEWDVDKHSKFKTKRLATRNCYGSAPDAFTCEIAPRALGACSLSDSAAVWWLNEVVKGKSWNSAFRACTARTRYSEHTGLSAFSLLCMVGIPLTYRQQRLFGLLTKPYRVAEVSHHSFGAPSRCVNC